MPGLDLGSFLCLAIASYTISKKPADRRRHPSRPTLSTTCFGKRETEKIIDDGANLIGPWRSPRQMLAEQVYDDHVSIHDDKTAQQLGFKGGAIEGPTLRFVIALTTKARRDAWEPDPRYPIVASGQKRRAQRPNT